MTLPEVDVLTFGETMGSIRTPRPLRLGGGMSMSLGGAETNVAIGLARLGHLARWAGRLGDDGIGDYALRTLRAEGVLTDAVSIDPVRPTGLMILESQGAGLSQATYYRSGSAASAMGPDDVEAPVRAGCRILHLTGITPALSESAAAAGLAAARQARAAGITVSFDVNFRSKLWGTARASEVLAGIAAYSDIVIASEDELLLLGPAGSSEEDAVQHLGASGVREVVVKRGADGATGWDLAGSAAGSVEHRDALDVPVVDTVGAGDAFTAGYLSATLDGLQLGERLDRGVALGAFAVSDNTDWERLPTRKELALVGRPSGTTVR
ncbi:sugar kinase [Arthrobacter sp. MDT1-65]